MLRDAHHHQAGGPPSHAKGVLPDRGQGGAHLGGDGKIAEAGDRQFAGDGHAKIGGGGEGGEGDQVVEADDGGRPGGSGEPFHRLAIGRLVGGLAVREPLPRGRDAAFGQDGVERVEAGASAADAGVVQIRDPGVPEVEQMLREGAGAGRVVGSDEIEFEMRPALVDQRDRAVEGAQLRHVFGRGDLRGGEHEKPVDAPFAHAAEHVGVFAHAGIPVEEERLEMLLPQLFENPAHDQRAPRVVDRVARHGHGLRLPALDAPHQGVGQIVELLRHPQDAGAGLRADALAVRERLGHGRLRHLADVGNFPH